MKSIIKISRLIAKNPNVVFVVLLIAVFIIHLEIAGAVKSVKLVGDEILYFRVSVRNALMGNNSFLPGSLEFAHRTRLNCRLF